MLQQNTTLRSEFTILSWKAAAAFIGGSLPLLLLGKAVLAVWISLGLLFGACAMLEDRPKLRDLKDIFFSDIAKMTIIMLLIFAASALNSVKQHYSLVRFYEMFYLSLASGFLVVVLRKMPKEYVKLALKVLGITTLVMGAFVLIDSLTDIQRLGYALHGGKDVAKRLEFIGTILAILSPFVWTWLFQLARQEGRYWAKKLGLPLSYLLFLTVILCGGVAGWVSCIVGVVVYLIMGGKWHGLVLNTKHWLLMILGLAVAFVSYHLTQGSLSLTFESFSNKSAEYFDFVEKSVNYIANTPVLGIGVNATRFLPTPEAIIGKGMSQNFLLQLLLETGFLGLSAAAVLILMVLYKLYQYSRVNAYGLAGLSSMIVFLVASLSNTSIFNAWWLAFFIALSALSIRLCKS